MESENMQTRDSNMWGRKNILTVQRRNLYITYSHKLNKDFCEPNTAILKLKHIFHLCLSKEHSKWSRSLEITSSAK
jgi:hypothetical protein